MQNIQNTSAVAINYGVSSDATTKHFTRNADELIEDIHYFYEINHHKGEKYYNTS